MGEDALSSVKELTSGIHFGELTVNICRQERTARYRNQQPAPRCEQDRVASDTGSDLFLPSALRSLSKFAALPEQVWIGNPLDDLCSQEQH